MDENTHEYEAEDRNVLWNIKTVSLENETETIHILWMDAPPEGMPAEQWMPQLVEMFLDIGEAPCEISYTEGEGLVKVVGVSE
tara:strand:- start:21 stop:269 length:249 start_codon:yes stop_codon:yes gene_type:complete